MGEGEESGAPSWEGRDEAKRGAGGRGEGGTWAGTGLGWGSPWQVEPLCWGSSKDFGEQECPTQRLQMDDPQAEH